MSCLWIEYSHWLIPDCDARTPGMASLSIHPWTYIPGTGKKNTIGLVNLCRRIFCPDSVGPNVDQSPVRQCACPTACIPNIDCTRQFENNFWQVIQYPSDNYNPVRTYYKYTSKCYTTPPPPPQHKRALNKEQFEENPNCLNSQPNIRLTTQETIWTIRRIMTWHARTTLSRQPARHIHVHENNI